MAAEESMAHVQRCFELDRQRAAAGLYDKEKTS